jgi:hypothetical protein
MGRVALWKATRNNKRKAQRDRNPKLIMNRGIEK